MISDGKLLEKELKKVTAKEQRLIAKRLKKRESKLNIMLSKKVPHELQSTLDMAFSRAFGVIFSKGTGVIEKTLSKNENASANLNVLISGVSGVGLGVLGIGVPDIVLFTGMMLKSIYEIARKYGFDYESEEEKQFILLLIQGAVTYGEQFVLINKRINYFIEKNKFILGVDVKKGVNEASKALSGELLYMKFLQGVPIVGAIGGAYDAVYMERIVRYANLKYYRRFCISQLPN